MVGGLFVLAGTVKALGVQWSYEWTRPAVPAAQMSPTSQAAPPAPADPMFRFTLKFGGPIVFRDEIRNYRLGSFWWIAHPAAIVLPWVEIVTGLALIFGFWIVESAILIGAMLLFFNGMVGWAMHRGLDIECGCFGGDTRVGWVKLAENFGLFALTILAVVGHALGRARRVPDSPPAAPSE